MLNQFWLCRFDVISIFCLVSNIVIFADAGTSELEKDIWGTGLIFGVVIIACASLGIIIYNRWKKAMEYIVQIDVNGFFYVSQQIKYEVLQTFVDFELHQRTPVEVSQIITEKYLTKDQLDRIVNLKYVPQKLLDGNNLYLQSVGVTRMSKPPTSVETHIQ